MMFIQRRSNRFVGKSISISVIAAIAISLITWPDRGFAEPTEPKIVPKTAPKDGKDPAKDVDEKPWRIVRVNRLAFPALHHSAWGYQKVSATLETVEFFGGVMRWNFAVTSPALERGQELMFSGETKLLDGAGGSLKLIGASKVLRPGIFGILLSSDEKTPISLDFPLPKPGQDLLTIRWGEVNQRIPDFTLRLPYRARPATAPEGGTATGVVEERVDTVRAEFVATAKQRQPAVTKVNFGNGSPQPYTVTIDKAEWLETGDLRLHLTCANRSDLKVVDQVTIDPLEPTASRMVDAKGGGGVYPLIGASVGVAPYKVVDWAVPPGESRQLWLEFRGPIQGGAFILKFEGASGILPIPITLPKPQPIKKP